MTNNVLTGAQLEQLLDRLEADFDESEAPVAIDLIGRLRATPLHASSIASIDRLHRLWMLAGDSTAARAVIDQDGALLLNAAPPQDRANMRMHLAMRRAQIAYHLTDEATLQQVLTDMCSIGEETPGPDASHYRQMALLDKLEVNASLDIAMQAVELRHVLDTRTPERSLVQAWDHSQYHRRRAEIFWRVGQHVESRDAAHVAVAAFLTAAADQDVDQDDWLRLGDSLVDIAPQQLATVHEAVTRLNVAQPLPRRRETEVRLARLAARALHAQGDRAGALAACEAARYGLVSGGADDFIDRELPWLVEAGRMDEAGRRAFFEIYEKENGMWESVPALVHARLVDMADSSVWWPLCAMRACKTSETLACLMSEYDASTALGAQRAIFGPGASDEPTAADCARIFATARALAIERAPQHPWIARLTAVNDSEAGVIDATTAAARLFAAALQGDMRDSRTAFSVFCAQADSVGLAAALKLAPPTLDSGLSGYNFALFVEALVEEGRDALPEHLQDDITIDLERLQQAAYEQGRAHFERYFETGRGRPFDGCSHDYSMLCNNLAIHYRFDETRYQDAIELHCSGIAASPFAEHYEGVMRVYNALGDHAEHVAAAERLWHFAAEHGFGRHDPNDYFPRVATSLYELDRGGEILIWLERLVQWQRAEGEEERGLSEAALVARVSLGVYLAPTHSEEASALWAGLTSQVQASTGWQPWIEGGNILHTLGRKNEAVGFYEKSLKFNPRETDYEKSSFEGVGARLAFYREEAQPTAAAKSRWKFWQ